jgi:CMP/dCMP kinase
MPRKINIAIDGHSSCGKGTLAKNIARDLNYMFIDSGAMYRTVALYLFRNQIEIEQVQLNPNLLEKIQITFEYNADKTFYYTYLNGENVETLIRGMEISKRVSAISAVKEVRQFLVEQQQNIGRGKGVVMDGRDIGTVVFPDAELKIFMTAEPSVRAKRRYLEMHEKGLDADYDEILANVQERDLMDSTRAISPLVQAPDAIVLNNTNMSREEQAQIALTWARGVIIG